MLVIVISNIIDLVNHVNHFIYLIFKNHIEIFVKFNTQFAKLVEFTLLKTFSIYL
jgi:hypothetical protein